MVLEDAVSMFNFGYLIVYGFPDRLLDRMTQLGLVDYEPVVMDDQVIWYPLSSRALRVRDLLAAGDPDAEAFVECLYASAYERHRASQVVAFDRAIDLVVRVAANSEGEAEARQRTLAWVQKVIDAREAARRKVIEMGPDLEVCILEHSRDGEDSP